MTRLHWCGRIVFACRVSVLSALAGFLLFSFVPQARDLFDDISYGPLPYSPFAWGMWLLFFVYVFLIWAFPVHFAARAILRTEAWMIPSRLRAAVKDDGLGCGEAVKEELAHIRREIDGCIRWTPRILGSLPFVAGFVVFVIYRQRIFTMSGRSAEVLAVASALAVTVFFILSYFAPFLQAGIAPRALVVPFLFGSLVFLGAALSWLGDLVGLPLLAGAIALAFGVTAFNQHFNDLRVLDGAPKDLARRQIEIADAVGKWKSANHCEGDKPCPPALIVAGEGGASRAAFAAATAIGDVLERSKQLPDHNELSPARRIFALSGVSGGALGAATVRTALWDALSRNGAAPPCRRAPQYWFGATEGDAEARVASDWRACLQALVSGDYLTAAFIGLGFRDNLSPPAHIVSGPTLLRDDRAALVERAWESYYDDVVEGRRSWNWNAARRGGPESASGLRRPFGYVAEALEQHDRAWLPMLLLNGTSVDKGTRILASDLVSTKPGTPHQGDIGGRAPLYPAAFDLFEMLSTPCPPAAVVHHACQEAHDDFADVPVRRDGADVRLSTTAMLSARFPIVSPAGTIRAKGDGGQNGDRVVDGGYFENAGITTALDVARALRGQGVTPILLWVQNDPTIDLDDVKEAEAPRSRLDRLAVTNPKTGEIPQFPPRAASTPRLQGAWPGWLQAFVAVVATPFEALTATRDGHALEAAETAQRRLQEMNAEARCVEGDCSLTASYFTFKMFRNPHFDEKADRCRALANVRQQPVMGVVSMSWWLSQSVQAELDSQLCDTRNRQSLDDLMKRLAQRLK
ncbi:hypothetical protein [Methylocystis echinoides]|uniref:hypothetical protein n=1 Tax=Methylocystis echinoides TaxID=29468 RepID=UPI0024922AC6|nr:hypothetical protein [Methylocystis echinoides]